MSFSGMDTQAVEQLSAQMRAQASVIAGIIDVVDGAVSGLQEVWSGDDLDAFANMWRQAHRPNAVQVSSTLGGWANQLSHQVDQQQEASGGAAAAGGGLSGLAGLWHRAIDDAKHVVPDAETAALRQFDEHWGAVRGQLVRVTNDLGNVTAVATVALPVLAAVATATGFGAPIGVALLATDVAMNEADSAINKGESSLVLVGDAAEAAQGDKQFADDLPGDGVNAAMSWVPDDKVFGAVADRLGDSMPALHDATTRLAQLADTYPGVASVAEGVSKEAENQAWKELGNAADSAVQAVPSLLRIVSAPLEAPQNVALRWPLLDAAL